MATTFNAYGQPNGTYNQPASSLAQNPVATALQRSPNTAGQSGLPNTGTPVLNNGMPNLALQAPTPLTGRYNNGDFDVNDAAQVVQNAAQTYLGRSFTPQDIQTQLQNQGWNPNNGDKYVGANGLNFVLSQIFGSPEAQSYRSGLTAQVANDPSVDRTPQKVALDNSLLLPSMQALENGGSVDQGALLANAKKNLALQRSLFPSA